MTTKAVEIRILGRAIRVNCPADQEHALLSAAKDFDKRLHELSERTNVSNVEQLLTIAALNLNHEFHKEQCKQEENKIELERRLTKLEQYVEQALVECNKNKETAQQVNAVTLQPADESTSP